MQPWAAPGIAAGYHLADANDFSGNSKTLTNNGSVAFGLGKFGDCAQFGSSNNSKYLSRADGLWVDLSGDHGISVWVKLAANPASTKRCRIVEWRSNTGSGRLHTLDYYNNSGTYQWSWCPNTQYAFTFDGSLTLNRWTKIDISVSGGYAYLYIDGVLIRTEARGTYSQAANKVVIGAEMDAVAGFFWFGDMDEYLFYSVHRSSQEIRRRYAFQRGMMV
jgi:hypothetical protein